MVWTGDRKNEDITKATMLMYQELSSIEQRIIQQLDKK
jgi:hypothetical protein